MIRKMLIINKIIIYIIVGLFTVIFHNLIMDNNFLYLLVGITTLLLGVEGMLADIIAKAYKSDHNHMGSELFRIVLAIVILFHFNKKEDFEMVCICWAILVVVSNTKSLNKSINHMFKGESFLFHMVFSIVQLVLAIILITDPGHHAKMHVIILGFEFLIEASEYLINVFYRQKTKALM